jgi:hypothetical protein
MGIDPNQGGSASCGVVVIELGAENRLVYVHEIKKKTTQEMTASIQNLVDAFNVKRIFMDSQGGGKPIRDLLQEGYGNKVPIIDLDDENTKTRPGKHILKLINPTPLWIADANFDTLALLENGHLRFPKPPMDSNPVTETLYEEVKILKSQLSNIIVTQTSTGLSHFDTPKKSQNKDLYSAFVLASWGAKELSRECSETDIVLHPQGYVRPHTSGAKFRPVVSGASDKDYTKSAILQRKLN